MPVDSPQILGSPSSFFAARMVRTGALSSWRRCRCHGVSIPAGIHSAMIWGLEELSILGQFQGLELGALWKKRKGKNENARQLTVQWSGCLDHAIGTFGQRTVPKRLGQVRIGPGFFKVQWTLRPVLHRWFLLLSVYTKPLYHPYSLLPFSLFHIVILESPCLMIM